MLRLDSLNAEFRSRYQRILESSAKSSLSTTSVDRSWPQESRCQLGSRSFTVYTSGRLANEPEFFGAPSSNYTYAYITGFVSIDILDAIQPDVVHRSPLDQMGTQRRCPIHELLQELVAEIGRQHRQLRREKHDEKIRTKSEYHRMNGPTRFRDPNTSRSTIFSMSSIQMIQTFVMRIV